MNRYCYIAETTDINEWLTAAHKLRNLIDEGTRGAVDVQEKSWYVRKKAHCHLIGTPSNPVAVYAITENLELVTLIKSPQSIILGSWLVCDAVAHGAGWLMCLDTPHLSKLYKNAGLSVLQICAGMMNMSRKGGTTRSTAALILAITSILISWTHPQRKLLTVAGVIWHPVRMTQKQGCYA